MIYSLPNSGHTETIPLEVVKTIWIYGSGPKGSYHHKIKTLLVFINALKETKY